jgi:hypothetical protein
MVLKYLTKCEVGSKVPTDNVFRDQWNFVGGITNASIYWDETNNATVAALEFESQPHMKIALYHEAYLLNENGKTIERIRV